MLFNKTFRKRKYQKVNFLIAGVQKGGTTILDHYLRQHSDICMANKKEVHFFDNEKFFFENTTPDYDLYHSHFDEFNKKKLHGEATPIYSYWEPSAKRIFNYNKDMKIILLLRNPIERAYSHWNKECINYHSLASTQKEAVETLSFYDAIINEKERCLTTLPLQHRYYSYTDRGFYVKQIERLFKYFPKKNIHILKSESFKKDPQTILNSVCNFLEVQSISTSRININTSNNTTNKTINKKSPVDSPLQNPNNPSNYISSITIKEKEYLKGYFEKEITNLEKLLDWDCSDWLI